MQVKIINGTSKKGIPYEAIKVSIGEYEGILFPSRAELAYLKDLLRKNAHKDFKGDDLADVEGE